MWLRVLHLQLLLQKPTLPLSQNALVKEEIQKKLNLPLVILKPQASLKALVGDVLHQNDVVLETLVEI